MRSIESMLISGDNLLLDSQCIITDVRRDLLSVLWSHGCRQWLTRINFSRLMHITLTTQCYHNMIGIFLQFEFAISLSRIFAAAVWPVMSSNFSYSYINDLLSCVASPRPWLITIFFQSRNLHRWSIIKLLHQSWSYTLSIIFSNLLYSLLNLPSPDFFAIRTVFPSSFFLREIRVGFPDFGSIKFKLEILWASCLTIPPWGCFAH